MDLAGDLLALQALGLLSLVLDARSLASFACPFGAGRRDALSVVILLFCLIATIVVDVLPPGSLLEVANLGRLSIHQV